MSTLESGSERRPSRFSPNEGQSSLFSSPITNVEKINITAQGVVSEKHIVEEEETKRDDDSKKSALVRANLKNLGIWKKKRTNQPNN